MTEYMDNLPVMESKDEGMKMNHLRFKIINFCRYAGIELYEDNAGFCEGGIELCINTKKMVLKKLYRNGNVIEQILELLEIYDMNLMSLTIRGEGIIEVCLDASSIFFKEEYEFDSQDVMKKSSFVSGKIKVESEMLKSTCIRIVCFIFLFLYVLCCSIRIGILERKLASERWKNQVIERSENIEAERSVEE